MFFLHKINFAPETLGFMGFLRVSPVDLRDLFGIYGMKLTFLPLKMDGWKTIFLLGPGLFSEANC